ncbi:MAG: hypothetical protein NZ898_03195 [Myxococcota bacterium]|nr:hypothetical protein [Myxococcota bacterium]MDW8361768.1 hypothetical protein [Myxococcales bacterium]
MVSRLRGAGVSSAARDSRRLGWLAGGSTGLLLSVLVGLTLPAWATVPVTFAAVVAGFYGGSALGGRIRSPRARRWLLLFTAVSITGVVALLVVAWTGRPEG